MCNGNLCTRLYAGQEHDSLFFAFQQAKYFTLSSRIYRKSKKQPPSAKSKFLRFLVELKLS
jgi:hypothetical protein